MDSGGIGRYRELPAGGPVQRRGRRCREWRSNRGEVAAHRPMAATEHPSLEPRLRPLLDRQDVDTFESRRVFARRFAALRSLSESARRENRARRRDSVPADTGVHRSAHDRCRNRDAQGVDLSLLSRPSRADRNRTGDHRPRRIRRRNDRARHPHVDRRWGTGRPLLRAAERPVGAGGRALARLSGTAHRNELPQSRRSGAADCVEASMPPSL